METKNLGDFLFIYEQFARSEGKSPQTISATKLAITLCDAILGADLLHAYSKNSMETSVSPVAWGDIYLGRNGYSTLEAGYDEFRISSVNRTYAWLKATDYSTFDNLVTFGSPTVVAPSITTAFVYDGNGKRVQKTVIYGPADNVTTTYVNKFYEKTGTAYHS